MSPTEYERRMKEARREVQELQQIYASNVYLPLLNSAEAERDEAVDLLNVVKERFGGGETTGRCHSNHQPRGEFPNSEVVLVDFKFKFF